ncbi:MAG: type II toxin-antitoxin system VapB family antitoxin [Proteobacteria bacterium]|nr:type II toxin-antitoxin system VapB family antitoxin [Pseudomonadota bacterium]
MRTTLNLNEEVINQVMQYTGIKNKSKAVNMVLETFVRERKRQNILKMKGKLNLDDNWKQLREMELDEG